MSTLAERKVTIMAPMQVMTAGGVSSAGRKKKKKKTTKKLPPTESNEEVVAPKVKEQQNQSEFTSSSATEGAVMEFEQSNGEIPSSESDITKQKSSSDDEEKQQHASPVKSIDTLYHQDGVVEEEDNPMQRNVWLLACFLGIMFSFVCYGLLLEYATSGGRKLHELSFLFVTSGLYTLTAAAGRHVRDEKPTSIPPARFAILGMTSMGSTFCSVRSLRYVIYPIQVLAKSCKPVPVMIMGALMGKKYPMRKYFNVCLIVAGVALFMGGGHEKKGKDVDGDSSSQLFGIMLLFLSLCFDGGTGAYEDKLMAVHSVGPFDLMYNIQLGKTILAGIGLLVLNQVHVFLQMCQDMGFLLVALGLSGALGQVFIFITISKFGALTCSIIGLARKVTTLVASILFYGHSLSGMQFSGLLIAVTAMVLNFWGKKSGGHGHHGPPPPVGKSCYQDEEEEEGDVELQELDDDEEVPLVKR